MNGNNNIYSTAFADDFIIAVADKDPLVIQERLNGLLNEINRTYNLWNLKINPTKCESIMFRRQYKTMSPKIRAHVKKFQLHLVEGRDIHSIPHKDVVEYLGIILDELLRLAAHNNKQLAKARDAFRAHSRLFFTLAQGQSDLLPAPHPTPTHLRCPGSLELKCFTT